MKFIDIYGKSIFESDYCAFSFVLYFKDKSTKLRRIIVGLEPLFLKPMISFEIETGNKKDVLILHRGKVEKYSLEITKKGLVYFLNIKYKNKNKQPVEFENARNKIADLIDYKFKKKST